MSPRRIRTAVLLLGVAALLSMALAAVSLVQARGPREQALLGRREFVNSRDPPFYVALDAATDARVRLGHAVFNTQWVEAGTPGAGDHDGVGPLFNGSSCDECHNEGADGRGPLGDGPAPQSLVIELQPPTPAGAPAPADPTYGHVLNTAALMGLRPEGSVEIRYQERTGRYPDGTLWHLRVPRYVIDNLGYGPLLAGTVIEPRLAPQLFGDGLLEAVPEAVITADVNGADDTDATGDAPGNAAARKGVSAGAPAWQWLNGRRQLGRFGWQGVSVSIRDQTSKAFAREMGLTNRDRPHDDCTAMQHECLARPNGGNPEVSDQLLEAVVTFERWLAVPTVNATVAAGPPHPLFVQLGCAGCHRPRLPVQLRDPNGRLIVGTIAPYTDLRLHDLGASLADRNVAGQVAPSRWRTPPLWGLGYRLSRERQLTLLHDGRARSIEEAILWHDGEAHAAREAFERLSSAQRQALLTWLASL